MIKFEDKIAMVTGAGSGIGQAISTELIMRGAKVWLIDVEEQQVMAVANKLGANAQALTLDVRDAEGIKALVSEIIEAHGRIDFLFNNAGIGVGGDMHDLDVVHFDRIIDVNIRGVMNGIAAVYPLMVKQGHGCIVNTASMAGLLPTPLMVPYCMTKHAVVGLSRSLRIEAAAYGVQVNALCPAAIETPLIDSHGPEDLNLSKKYDVRRYLSALSKPYPVETFAQEVLDGVQANKEIIIAPKKARLVAKIFRFSPRFVLNNLRNRYLKVLKRHSE